MLKNYLRTAWRNMMKNKISSSINVFGLTTGITVCLMIFLFVMNEFSVDKFHQNNERIFRVMRGYENEGKKGSVAFLSGLYAPALLNDYPGDIEKAVRVSPASNLVTVGNKSFRENKVYNVDADFFSLFSFPLLKGNAQTVLRDPGNVVLTESTAKKFFGSVDNAFGQVIEIDKALHLKVTGISRDVPANSHLYFDLVVPLSNYKDGPVMKEWVNNGLYTYVLLGSHVSAQRLESRLPQFVEKYLGSALRNYGFHWSLSLTPLTDVYFSSPDFDNERHGDKAVVYIFLSIAVFIFLIACINFMNLSAIGAVDRSKEVGVRKVLGALRASLVWQFIGEAVLLAIISCLFAIVLLSFAMPLYNQLLGYRLSVSWHSLHFYLFLGGVVMIVGFLAGSYPALLLSAFSPMQALKGKLRLGRGGSTFRQALVVVQFSISVFLIVGTLIITKQMHYVKNKQLGYNKEQTMLVRIDNKELYENLHLFKTSLLSHSAVQNVSLMSGEPGGFFDNNVFEVQDHTDKWTARTEFADFEFVNTLGLKIIAGRDLSATFPSDTTEGVLINRTAATKLGWTPEEAIGKWIKNTVRDNGRRRITGVVQDFNFQTLRQTLEPLVISPNADTRLALIKLKAADVKTGVAAVEKEYKKIASAYPFDYRFLDDQFDDLYKKDIRQKNVLSIFAILAIAVACLGLFGLSSFAITRRFKEIGVRKVLGSSVRGIVFLLSKDLLKPVLIAALIALPAGYWAMEKWLQDFAYRTDLSWWVFALAALSTLLIALITVSVKAVHAALANPTRILRTE